MSTFGVPQDVKIAVGLAGTLVASVALLSPAAQPELIPASISLASSALEHASDAPFAYASSGNPLIKTNQDTTAFANALKSAGCYTEMYDRSKHAGWSSGTPTDDQAKCDAVLDKFVGEIGVSSMLEWVDQQADQGTLCTHSKSMWPTEYYPNECIEQEGITTEKFMSGEQYQNWAHRLGAYSSNHARDKVGNQRYGLEATMANVGWHHGIHGAMWEPIVNAKDTSKAWSLHGENANWIKFKDVHMFIDSCHGVGHSTTYFTPGGSMPADKQLSMAEAAQLCASQPYNDYRCQACCNDGIFHESSVADLHNNWAEKSTATLPDSISMLDDGILNKLKSCQDVGTLMPFFCYRWTPIAVIAGQLNETPEDTCKIITKTDKMAIQAISGTELLQLGACLAGQFGTNVPFDDRTTMPALTDEYCDGLDGKSYALWLMCSYGGMHAEAHLIFDLGSYAPVFRPKLMSTFITSRCDFTDELAKVLCEVEVFDGFAGASLISNATFMEAVNKPKGSMNSDASFKAHHQWALSHFLKYNSTLENNPSSMTTPLS